MMMSHLRTSAMPSARPTRSSSSRDIARPIAALLCSRMPGKNVKVRVVAALSISCTCASLHVHGFICQACNQQEFMLYLWQLQGCISTCRKPSDA